METVQLIERIEKRLDAFETRLSAQLDKHDDRLGAVERALAQIRLVGMAASTMFAAGCSWFFSRHDG